MINLNSLTKNIKDGFKAPTGDNNRETPTKGALRFNTQTGKPEIYAKGRGWRRASVSEISAIYTHDNLVAFYDASNADTTGDTSDQYYSDVELLLHMNGTNGSTTFTDNSSASNTASNTNTEISTDQFKFGGSSAYFDGTAYLNYSSGLTLGSSNFTFETWVYISSIGSRQYIFDTRGGGAGGVLLTVEGNGKVLFSGGIISADTFSTSTLSNNSWYHLAAVRDGSTARLFIDGTQEATVSISGTAPDSQLIIGAKSDGSTKLTGYIDEFRLTIGTARYTSNFTPQTREFYPGDSVSDLTSNDIDSVYVGNVTLNSTEPKSFNWATWQAYGDVNYLESVSNASALPVLNDNLTIVAWVKYDDGAFSSNRYHQIMYLFVDESNVIKINKVRNGYSAAPNKLYGQLRSGGTSYTVGIDGSLPSLSSSTGWFQVALTLSNDELKLYFNADQIGSTLTVPSSRSTTQPAFAVGRNYNTDETLEADMYGEIALVKVYNSALSSADITSEFNYHKSTFGL